MRTNKKRIVLPSRRYFFKIDTDDLPHSVEVELHDRKRFGESTPRYDTLIGSITLESEMMSGRGKLPLQVGFRTHSSLDSCYHGKGLGVLMYAKAIQWALKHGCLVQSSGGSSPMAQRVWKSKSLKKYFKIKQIKRRRAYGCSATWQAYVK